MGKPEAIIFDLYNTLLENDTDEEREDTYLFLSLWLSYHGVRIKSAELRRLYLDLCHKHISRSGEPYPDIEIGEVFSAIIAANRDLPPTSAMVSEMALLFRMLTTNHLSPFPGVIAMLGALKGRVKLGIASNAQRLFTIPELTRFGMADFFDAIVFSSDVGACKPHRRVFETVLEALSVRAEEAVYVGDNLLADIYGARNSGMRAVWINRGKQEYDHREFKPDAEAGDTSSLHEMLVTMVEG